MTPQVSQPDRRRFLNLATAAGAFFAAHGCGDAEEPKSPAPTVKDGKVNPRIRSLELASFAPLVAMKEFYHRLLGLPVAEDKPTRLAIDAGQTRITFVPSTEDNTKPFYHFAFNVPE